MLTYRTTFDRHRSSWRFDPSRRGTTLQFFLQSHAMQLSKYNHYDVRVCCPVKQHSGQSHAISINGHLWAEPYKLHGVEHIVAWRVIFAYLSLVEHSLKSVVGKRHASRLCKGVHQSFFPAPSLGLTFDRDLDSLDRKSLWGWMVARACALGDK